MQLLPAFLSLGLLLQAEPGALPSDPQPPAAPPAPASLAAPTETAAPAPATLKLAKGQELQVELANGVSSMTAKLSERFPLRLVEPIRAPDGTIVVAAGALGEGEVIDAAPAGIYGKQGKLVISARFLDLNGKRVRIRGMSLIAAGQSQVDLSTTVALVPYVGLAAFMIKGGDIQFPTGTRATVKLGEDVEFPITTTVPKGDVQ